MKKLFVIALMAVLGGSCLCGNAITGVEESYRDDAMLLAESTSITVNYESKSENTFNMVLKHPEYSFTEKAGSCACIAGANVIGFYDRYDENLIPDHDAGKLFMGKYIYSIEDSAVFDVIRQLYSDMGTDDTGTTVAQFISGMRTYCSRKGKSISFISCMAGGSFDYSSAKTHMEENRPVVLFCAGYNVATINTYENSDKIYNYESTANHVMVGFGYKDITYTMANSSTALYRYFEVASGVPLNDSGYYNIDYKTKINDAYAINIY